MTLVPSKNAFVVGVAYEIAEENVEKTFKYLDFREKCGYTQHEVDFNPLDDRVESFKSSCYYANEQNSYFSMENNVEFLARHIIASVGPSGTNLEYFFNLCESLRQLHSEAQWNPKLGNLKEFENQIFDIEGLIKKIILN